MSACRRLFKLFALAFIFVLAAAGCSTGPSVVGKWKVDESMMSTPGLPPGFMTGFASTFKYEFKPDKTFTGAMSSGTYTFENGKLSMLTLKVGGADVPNSGAQPQMTGAFSEDGKFLVLHPNLTGLKALMKSLKQDGNLDGIANVKMTPDK